MNGETQEPDHLPLRALLVVAAITIAIFVGSVVGAAGPALSIRNAPVPPPRDTLERTLVANTERGPELQRKRAQELSSWGWIDRDAGIARMPIDEAIDLTVKEQR
jgi:hypothetical protein